MVRYVLLYPIMNRIVKLFLPQSCTLCGSDGNILCPGCIMDLPYFAKHDHIEETDFTYVDEYNALFTYSYPVDKLIQQAKFNHNLLILRFFGQLMADSLDFSIQPDVIIPVPLHPKRLRQRGYNQSLLLAQVIQKQLNLPLDYKRCRKIIYTKPQVKSSAKERLTNLKGAFKVSNWPEQWQQVLLIDDVITTGSTVEEVSLTLKAAGVNKIAVWCCARTVSDII